MSKLSKIQRSALINTLEQDEADAEAKGENYITIKLTREDVNEIVKSMHKADMYAWHNLVDNPTDTPEKYNCDWVLAQIVEDNGFVWIPKVAEYRKNKDDWYCEQANGWLKNSNGLFKVVAWCELPTNDWSDSKC